MQSQKMDRHYKEKEIESLEERYKGTYLSFLNQTIIFSLSRGLRNFHIS